MSTQQPENADQAVLLVLTSVARLQGVDFPAGTSGHCFVELYAMLTAANLRLELATPNGLAPEFHNEDEQVETWMRQHKQVIHHPVNLETVQEKDYAGCIIPHAPGMLQDVVGCATFGATLQAFQTKLKPIATIGYGTAALTTAMASEDEWCFSDWNMTAVSVMEMIDYPFFDRMPLIVEDFIKDNGGHFSCSENDALHMVLDRNLVTGQNTHSTAAVTHNFIWLLKGIRDNKAIK